MAEIDDTYKTIDSESMAQFTEQRSRFISFAWHVTDTDQVKEHVSALQKEYYDARHICYAYMLGPQRLEWRANDNGEPSGTAGKPILGQINSAGLTDILVCVVRYFGGVKLGTSGLIEAYRKAAADAIEAANKVTLYVEQELHILTRYTMMNEVMRAVKDMGLAIVSEEYGQFTAIDPSCTAFRPYDCRYTMRMRKSLVPVFTERIGRLTETQTDPSLLIEQK